VSGAVGALGAAGGLLARRLRDDFRGWASQVERSGYCVRPVRIRGGAEAVDTATGEVRHSFITDGEPDGVLLIACGDRRSAVCPPCAERYRADLWHVIAAGLRGRAGGSGPRSAASAAVPESVSAHPALFVTLTAPSFGHVHTIGRDGRCRPRQNRPVCEHGTAAYCHARHAVGDSVVGNALCVECYDYAGHVLWHSAVPELWRRFVVELPRAVSRLSVAHTGVHRTVRAVSRELRLSYVRVAEWQRRAAVHLHAVIRADGRGDEGAVVAPPGWMTRGLLDAAVRDAVARVRVALPAVGGRERIARWGGQIDVKQISEPRKVAAYLAKYATKTASDTLPGGWPVRRFGWSAIDRMTRRRVSWHLLLLAGTCLRLAALPECAGLGLADHVHNLGYRGHYSSKSRIYSTTLRALGAARRAWRAEQRGADVWASEGSGVEVVGDWRLVGVGYASAGDALLAEQLARDEAAYREAVRLHDVRRILHADGEGV
jgi:hypothetical protein